MSGDDSDLGGPGGGCRSGSPAGNSGKETRRDAEFRSRSDRDRQLARLLRAEDVLTTQRLLALGYTNDELTRLVKHGDLVRLHRRVYVDGRTRTTPWVRLKAALLAAGPTAFLSHRTAAAARNYRNINTREIHVSVVADHTPKIPGLIIHRTTTPGRGEVTTTGGLRASTVPRILVELAPTAKRQELDELITAAERRNALDPEFMETVLTRHARRPGIAKLTAALSGHISTPAGNSGFEADVWAWWATEPDLRPPDEIDYFIGEHEYDGVWWKERLVLEIDSREYHQAKADMETDRIKDIEIQKLGLRVIRITSDRFKYDKAGIRADFLALSRLAA